MFSDHIYYSLVVSDFKIINENLVVTINPLDFCQ